MTEIESLHQQLSEAQEDRDMYRSFYETGINNLLNMKSDLNHREKQIVNLRDALHKISLGHGDSTTAVPEKYWESVKFARQALTATEPKQCPTCAEKDEVLNSMKVPVEFWISCNTEFSSAYTALLVMINKALDATEPKP